MSLIADITAPADLSDEQKVQLTRHPKIIRLSRKSKRLVVKIRRLEYTSVPASKGTRLYDRKKKTDAILNRKKMKIRDKMRR